MYTISKQYSFCAAHRIEGHPKCGRLHGHNYRVTVTIHADNISKQSDPGMILDYGELDRVFKPVIEEFDHRYIVSMSNVAANDGYAILAMVHDHAIQPVNLFASTAECLAEWLYKELVHMLEMHDYPWRQWLYTIEVKETDKSAATYTTSSSIRSGDV